MVWSAEEVLEWVNEHGGLDGGGLAALQLAVDEQRFAPDRERGAKRFLQDARRGVAQLAREEKTRAELARVGEQFAADRREQDQLRADAEQQRKRDLELAERGVLAAESQAGSALEALRTSRVAAGISLLALIVAVIALLAPLMSPAPGGASGAAAPVKDGAPPKR